MGRSIVVLAAVVALIAVAPSSTSHARARASLSLDSLHPLSVQGRHFHRRERVRVVVDSAGGPFVHRVRASRSGTFSATFPHAGAGSGPCGNFSVTAKGRQGSRATLHMMHPDCVVD